MALLLLVGCATRRYEQGRVLMGTRARVVLYASSDAAARRALRAALDRIAALELVMSDYRDDSELMRLCAAGGGRVSDDLRRVLELSLRFSRETDGAFDISVGPLVRLWRKARTTGARPDVEGVRGLIGWQRIRLDGHRLRLKPGMRLDLGGIGKGFAADEAVRTLRAHGIERCLVDLGGDIVCGAPPPGRAGWRIEPGLILAHRGVATSGDTERFVEIGGVRYSHIVDPRTGLGLTNSWRVTVIAATGAEADALASAASVRGPE